MQRNIEQEIDEIKQQIEDIKNILIKENNNGKPEFLGHIKKKNVGSSEEDPAAMDILNNLEDICGTNGETGRITYLGVFSSGGNQSTWIQNGINTDELLKLIENRTAEKVLNCIGNNDRLNLLLALLKEPMTVAKLVEKCGYNSTGQVYHHLKPLIAADLIEENKNAAKGTYFVKPHRVQGIIMLLAGIHDMTDVKYSKGIWDNKTEIHGGAKMIDERYMTTEEENEKIIKTFFKSREPLILKSFPAKEKKKIVVLRIISEQFEKGKRYDNKQVDQILKPIYEDYVTIRRYLIAYGFMNRTMNCREYWLNDDEKL